MAYLITVYLVVGFIATFILAPRFLRKRGIDSYGLKKDHLWILLDPPELGMWIIFILSVSSLWPVVVPIWLWSEISSKKAKEAYLEQDRIDKERKMNDPNYGLTIDQKIEKLRKLSEEN